MITLSLLDNGSIQISQSFVPPTVYLDHWAIQRLCENATLRERFVLALKTKNGTLVLSHVSLAEVSMQTDARHAAEAELFLDAVMPNLYFALFDLEAADARARLPDAKLHPPSADINLMKFLATRQSSSLKQLSAIGLISPIAEYRDHISQSFTETSRSISDKINEHMLDSSYLRRARTYQGERSDPLTSLLMGQLLRPIFLGKKAATPNDAVDLQHAVISLAYCDFVLLDGAWTDNARQAGERLSKAGLPCPVARVFSDRRGDFERFLGELEAFAAPKGG